MRLAKRTTRWRGRLASVSRGPHVDRMALEAEEVVELPRVWLEPDSYDFSFSGLKSAVLNVVNQSKMRGEEVRTEAIARVSRNPWSKCSWKRRFVRSEHMMRSVAANRGLRKALAERASRKGYC